MDKKLVVWAVLAVFVMVGVSMASAVNTAMVSSSDKKNLDKLDSPLFKVRSQNAIADGEQENSKLHNFIKNCLENRIFLRFPIINLFIKRVFNFQRPNPEQNYRLYDTYSKCTYTADSAMCNAAGMPCYTEAR